MRATEKSEGGHRRVPSLGLWLLAGLSLIPGWSAQARAAGYSNNGPVRMARVSYVIGDVSWRRDSRMGWSSAVRNLPLRQGAQIWVPAGSRAEIQFDDGSRLRLGSNALVTLQTLYSDAEGEFTEITLNDGLSALRLKNKYSIYQVNTPIVSLKATGPARLRIGTGDMTQIVMWQGRAMIEGRQGRMDIQTGDCLDLRDPNSPYHITGLPPRDSFDIWNDERDRALDSYARRYARRGLPSNIALVADDLDDYGTWRHDRRYGNVWCPRVTTIGWRPYCYGHWVWVDPFGWTWVSDEPWGWAPYHYGTWIREPYGWAWCPGPRYQYWSPAVVSFTVDNGAIGWVPLAPREVVYPSFLSIGFRSGDWSLFFSIGQAAVYYPTSRYVFVADPWPTSYVNRVVYVNNTTVFNNVTVNRNTFLTASGFVPLNARVGGVTIADPPAFGGRGAFRLASRQQAVSFFSRGRFIAAPARGHSPVAGPSTVRPTMLALTPTRKFQTDVRVGRAVLDRPVYRAPLRPGIARASAPPLRTLSVNPAPRLWPRAKAISKGAPFAAGTRRNVPRLTGPPVAAYKRPHAGPGHGIPGGGAERARRARTELGMHAGAPRTQRPGNNRAAVRPPQHGRNTKAIIRRPQVHPEPQRTGHRNAPSKVRVSGPPPRTTRNQVTAHRPQTNLYHRRPGNRNLIRPNVSGSRPRTTRNPTVSHRPQVQHYHRQPGYRNPKGRVAPRSYENRPSPRRSAPEIRNRPGPAGRRVSAPAPGRRAGTSQGGRGSGTKGRKNLKH
jgi:hypothetical protein